MFGTSLCRGCTIHTTYVIKGVIIELQCVCGFMYFRKKEVLKKSKTCVCMGIKRVQSLKCYKCTTQYMRTIT